MSDNLFRSKMSMDFNCINIRWSNGEGIRSELFKFKDLDVSWRLMFYPRFLPKFKGNKWTADSICEPDEQHSLIKFIIEDQTNETLQYNCRFSCDDGLELDWNFDFSNSEEKVIYDSSMTRTIKCIERTHEIPIDVDDYEMYNKFKIKAEITVKITPKIIQNLSSSIKLMNESILWSDFDDNVESSSSFGEIVAPTSTRSPAFLACISKIIAESKGEDSFPDLMKLATQLLEAAEKFELPDLKKIAAGFLDFQISNENFADILEMAVDQKIPALSNLSTDFITKNQRELRQTEQWAKMKACPLMMFSVMEKLFIEKKS